MATILCVDDDLRILEVYQALLEGMGFRVLIAPDGATGIALSRQQTIDVVVLDFNMPGLDGNEIAEVMISERPTVPVLICSGDPDKIPESLRWFAYAVLHKGDGFATLASVIESLANQSRNDQNERSRRAFTKKRTA